MITNDNESVAQTVSKIDKAIINIIFVIVVIVIVWGM